MTPMQRMVFLLGIATVLAVPASAQELLLEEEAIDYRQHVMRTMSNQVSIIGMILEQRAPADDFAKHVEVLALAASTARWGFAFEVPGGDAKPEVWSNWSDFAERMDALAEATAEMAKLAKEGGVEAVAPRLQETLTCRSCHNDYRDSQ